MLQHFGDTDIMNHLNNMLAIPRGYPPPTQLPDEFHNYVVVVEIIDSLVPGFVYLSLQRTGLVIQNCCCHCCRLLFLMLLFLMNLFENVSRSLVA